MSGDTHSVTRIRVLKYLLADLLRHFVWYYTLSDRDTGGVLKYLLPDLLLCRVCYSNFNIQYYFIISSEKLKHG